ncbi:uncharacterized protein [Clytia hemisphaerica]|uniref:uncharacterized protein n=1 Tax=Clytia hemisphaerica TaxID=252671 RepID=UPI0034D6754A
MNSLFGISFVLFYLKLSAGNGFWINLRAADENLYKIATTVERLEKKLKRYEASLNFLINCRDQNVFPKFVRWKNTKYLDQLSKRKYQRRILLDEIITKRKQIREIKTVFFTKRETLNSNATFMRKFVIEHSIKIGVNKFIKPIRDKLNHKLDLIIKERDRLNGISKNPNTIITNLSSHTLSEDEYKTLRFGLNHGLAKQPKDTELLLLQKNFGISSKFRKVNVDPTASRLTSIQRYLKTLLNRNEIDENEYKDMRPKNAKPARAHGLPKIHKKYEHLPKFRPIVDTTGTTHYSVGKYLTNLLNPLTVNDYTLKDSFDAAEKIKQIPKELFDDGYVFVSDKFEDETPHFLDLEIAPDGLSIFRKDTNTGLYTNFDSYAPWSYRKAWISSLANRATKLCHPAKLKNEINLIKKFASWNGFPRFAVNKIIKTATSPRHSENDNADNTIPTTLWLRIPYAGPTGEQLVSALKRKLKFCLKKDTNVMFRVIYSTHKIGFYTNMKDPTPLKFKSNIVYRFICPGCRASYVGKTERNLFTRCSEHATKKESAVLEHLKECSEVKFITTLLTLGIEKPNFRSIYINLVNDNTSVIDSSDNWSSLLYKEALHIKRLKPILNNGLKASRELYLF